MTDQRDLFGERKGTTRSAVISDCRSYRYRLDRRWSKGTAIAWVMLNPSTADGDVDDATIRKISAYSKKWGHGALVVVNLFAYRSTHPKKLRSPAVEPTGGCTADSHIRESLAASDTVVCAWGGSGPESLVPVGPEFIKTRIVDGKRVRLYSPAALKLILRST